MERLQGGAKDDLLKKNNSLLAFDFEAAARLKAWDSLEQLIKVSNSHFEMPRPDYADYHGHRTASPRLLQASTA